MPDLITQTRDVEPRQVGALEPLGSHCAAPPACRRWALLEEQHRLPGLSQAVSQRDAGSTRADDDVVIGLVRGDGRTRGRVRRQTRLEPFDMVSPLHGRPGGKRSLAKLTE